jgi:predicted nucleic acid-binding protein
MAGFRGRIGAHQVVGIDSVTFIYHFERSAAYFPLTQPLFLAVLRGEISAITSVVTLAEVTVLPLRQQKEGIARSYESAILHFPHLQVTNVSRRTAHIAARLRAEFRLTAPDALQVATSIQHNATAFVTNDKQMRRLSGMLDIVILDDFI